MSPYRRFALRFLALIAVLLMPMMAQADTQDITAASRSVVRVALVATDGDSAYFVGHGSGVVVAPGKVLTNAHVVEVTRTEPNIVIGIIPPEGKKSYGGRVIAYSPGNDLALIAYDASGNLPVATFYSGVPGDSQQVTAIGYPGSVDRAQGMNLQDIIHPMSPIRTNGTVSAGRQSKQFDTILHTAQLASGNSGGPLVDECGRVLGVNSFSTISDGNDDAGYYFAVSDREIAAFLRQAGIQPQRSMEPCRSLAEIDAAQRVAEEQQRALLATRASQEGIQAREAALAEREKAQQTVIARRENMMALAALLLAGAAVAGTFTFMSAQRQGEKTKLLGITAGILAVAAILVFLLRPGFDSIESAPEPDNAAANASNGAEANVAAMDGATSIGDNVCRIDMSLSRVTVSDTNDVPFHWDGQGCINGQTQMVQGNGGWRRLVVPASEASISMRRFDPATGIYRSDKYLIGTDVAEQARTMRGSVKWSGCTADPQRLAQLAQLQDQISMLLPPQPNERLVYHCGPGKAPVAPPSKDEQ
jgi:hypothetical protein